MKISHLASPTRCSKRAEAAAKDLGLSRSKLIQTALEEFLQRRRDEEVTRCLNRSLDNALAERGRSDRCKHLAIEAAMKRTEWKKCNRKTQAGMRRLMKTAISLPDPLFKEAEAAAKDLGLSRSKLIQTALEDFSSAGEMRR